MENTGPDPSSSPWQSLFNNLSPFMQNHHTFPQHHPSGDESMQDVSVIERNEPSPGTMWAESRPLRRRDLAWEDHKAGLKKLYLREGKDLKEIVLLMKSRGLDATEPQFKKQFADWGWRKNLPAKNAVWMVHVANKRKREKQKDTVFRYGGRIWTKQQAEARAKRARTEEHENEIMDLTTPNGVDYVTPSTINTGSPESQTHERRGESNAGGPEHVIAMDAESDDSDEDNFSLTWRGLTRAEVGTLFKAARSQATAEGPDVEGLFLQALEGHAHLLGPTHRDTCKVVDALATYYAQHDRLVDAYGLLDTNNKAHVKRWGLKQKETQQRILQVVQMLDSWNRPEDALAYLSRVKEAVETSSSNSGKDSAGHDSRLLDVIGTISPKAGAAVLDHAINVARSHVLARDPAVEPLLIAIVDRCGFNASTLASQNLKARSELLKLYIKLKTTSAHAAQFHGAIHHFNTTLNTYPWHRDNHACLDVMEGLLEIAAAVLRSGINDQVALDMFRRAEERAQGIYLWDDERSIWISISIGVVYQSYRGWWHAQEWFEHALNAAIAKLGYEDGITKSLQKAREKHEFSYIGDEGRPYKSVFGVCGTVIRPGRLHLD